MLGVAFLIYPFDVKGLTTIKEDKELSDITVLPEKSNSLVTFKGVIPQKNLCISCRK